MEEILVAFFFLVIAGAFFAAIHFGEMFIRRALERRRLSRLEADLAQRRKSD